MGQRTCWARSRTPTDPSGAARGGMGPARGRARKATTVEVRMVPSRHRPGVGLSPARENRRAFLPQHARTIPMVEEANRLGFLVYPPLHLSESLQLQARGDGVLTATFFVGDANGWRQPAFVGRAARTAGFGGLNDMSVTILNHEAGYDEWSAGALLEALLSGIHSPPGTVGVRGTHHFITPEGWDTVFTGVLNDVQRPAVGVLSMRAETDWFPMETEFRYVLEKGDVLSIIGGGPIGQVFFVPRDEPRLLGTSEPEHDRFAASLLEHAAAGARTTRVMAYGGPFTELYREAQQARGGGGNVAAPPDAPSDAPPGAAPARPSRRKRG